ncbi:MAG: haloacid dehalogenase, partial [Thermodesulfobacteriota bacterium]
MGLNRAFQLNGSQDERKSIRPATLAFDVDCVFADTMRLFLEIARSEFRINGIQYEDITCYNLEECLPIDSTIIEAIIGKILDGNHMIPLKPIDSAPEVIARIARDHGSVLFVTARSNPEPVRRWMEQVLPSS